MKNTYICFLSGLFFLFNVNVVAQDQHLKEEVVIAIKRSAEFFLKEVATKGGYLFYYKSDFTMRQGEEVASPSMIWVQPPGTPAVGMAFYEAYKATGDRMYLNGAVSASRALVWGQLATGGWDYRIDFDQTESKKWHYRRDVEKGDTVAGSRRNTSTLDDRTTQSALQLLMTIDRELGFKDEEIHNAALYCLNALLKVQYPNGAWPQRFRLPPDPSNYPVLKAHYPETWSKEFPGVPYDNYYTFNDGTMADVISTMIEAFKIYNDERYISAAKRCGDFIILAQMPEPQPAWAQQYNLNMEPAWARKFEPPAVTGGESFSVMRTLLKLYVETGDGKFLEPIPKALKWAENSLLPDKRLARFYELKTNRPLYFNASRQYSNLPQPAFPDLKDYTLIYEDTDLPNHYAFKVAGTSSIEGIRSEYNRIIKEGREKIIKEQMLKQVRKIDPETVKEIISRLDDRGRWLENGRLKTGIPEKLFVDAEIISCQTFIRNITTLSNYLNNMK